MNSLSTSMISQEGVCEFLCTELRRSIPSVYRVEIIGNKVFILYRETLQGEQYGIDGRVSELSKEIEGGDKFEYITRKTCTTLLETSEVERQMLEARVRSRIGEFTEDPDLGEVQSVHVVWDTVSGILRALGLNSTKLQGVLSVSNRASRDNHHTLSALRSHFGIPFTLRDVPPTKKD